MGRLPSFSTFTAKDNSSGNGAGHCCNLLPKHSPSRVFWGWGGRSPPITGSELGQGLIERILTNLKQSMVVHSSEVKCP